MVKKIVFLILIFCFFVFGAKAALAACPAGNIACGKRWVVTSSNGWGCDGTKVTDGNYGTAYNTPGWTYNTWHAVTNNYTNALIQIDLGQPYSIGLVKAMAGANGVAANGMGSVWGNIKVYLSNVGDSCNTSNYSCTTNYLSGPSYTRPSGGSYMTDNEWLSAYFPKTTPAMRYITIVYNGVDPSNYPVWREIEAYVFPTCTLTQTTTSGLNSPYNNTATVGKTTTFTANASGTGVSQVRICYASAGQQNYNCAAVCNSSPCTLSFPNSATTSYDVVCTADNGSGCSSNPICANDGCIASYGKADCGTSGRILNFSAYNCPACVPGSCTNQCGQAGTCGITCNNAYGSINANKNCSGEISWQGKCLDTCRLPQWASCGQKYCTDRCSGAPIVNGCGSTCCPATCSSTNNCGAACGTKSCSDGCGGTITCNTGLTSQACTTTFGTCSVSGTRACVNNQWSPTCSATDPRIAACTNKHCGESNGCSEYCSADWVGVPPYHYHNYGATEWSTCTNICNGAGEQSRIVHDQCHNVVNPTIENGGKRSCTDGSGMTASCPSWPTCNGNSCGMDYSFIKTASLNTGLVSHWKLDGNLNDSVGTNHGTNNGSTDEEVGKINNGRSFNGTSDYINVPSLTWTPTAFSVGWWLYPKTASNWSQHMAAINGWGAFVFHTTTNREVYVGTECCSTRFTPTELPAETVTLNQWQHFTYTYDGSQGRFYKNGVLLAGPKTQTPPTAWGGFRMGYAGGTHTIDGAIDDVAIWNRALTNGEVNSLYTDTGGRQDRECNTDRCGKIPQSRRCVNTSSVGTGIHSCEACGNTCGVTSTKMCQDVCGNSLPQPCTDTSSCDIWLESSCTTWSTCVPSQTCSTSYSNQTRTCYSACHGQSNTCSSTSKTEYKTCVAAGNAGIVSSGGSINDGGSNSRYSQSGEPPGFNLTNYTNQTNTEAVSYDNLLKAVLRNSGAGSETQLNTYLAATGTYTIGNYKFYSYSSTNFETILENLDVNYINVLIPSQTGTQTINTVKTIGSNVRTIVFVNGALEVLANITTSTGNSSIVFILNDPGDLTTSPSVTKLDGIYIFRGNFNDGGGANQLVGHGSLIATDPNPVKGLGEGFLRTYINVVTGEPAEKWIYEPKYLRIYKNVLAVPQYSWSELLPE